MPNHYINGENFIIPQDELDNLMDQCVARAVRAKKRRECAHDFGPWACFDRLEQRVCKLCRKVEYK